MQVQYLREIELEDEQTRSVMPASMLSGQSTGNILSDTGQLELRSLDCIKPGTSLSLQLPFGCGLQSVACDMFE